MELRLGVQALALCAIVALGGNTVNVSADDVAANIELDFSDETTAGYGHVTIHANDVLVLKGSDTTGAQGFHGDGTNTKGWCKDKLPALDVAMDVTCADGLKTVPEVWAGAVQTGTTLFDASGLTISFGAAGESTITAFLRIQMPETNPTANWFVDVKVLSLTEQNSAFSAAYAAGTFVASSMLVAAIALF